MINHHNHNYKFYARSLNWEKRILSSTCLFLRPHGTNRLPLKGFSWNLISEFFFEKYVHKIQFSLKYDKNNGYFT